MRHEKILPIILVLTLAACGGGSGGAQNESVYFNTEFYGDDNIPAEAVALFQYQQKVMDTPKEGGGNLNIFLGFGGRTK